ncbi:hypothetical protein NL676_009745 [Syzygium grande]|nr:hypothetical protein NL676_009745 [Syzygium grande]
MKLGEARVSPRQRGRNPRRNDPNCTSVLTDAHVDLTSSNGRYASRAHVGSEHMLRFLSVEEGHFEVLIAAEILTGQMMKRSTGVSARTDM